MRKMRVKLGDISNDVIEILPDRFEARHTTPKNKRDMKLFTINLTYLYYFDFIVKKIKNKYRVVKKKMKDCRFAISTKGM